MIIILDFNLNVLKRFLKDWLVPKATVTIMQMQKNLSERESSPEIVSANQDLLVQGVIVVS